MMHRGTHCTVAIAFTFLLFSSAFSQSPVKVEQVDFLGRVSEGVYRNDFLGIEVPVPKGWHLVDQETTSASMQMGLNVLKSKNERSNQALEAATKREVIVLHFAKKPMGSGDNAMFMIGVMKQPSESVLPSMVAEATKSLFLSTTNIKVVQDTRSGIVAGKKFALVDYRLTVNEQTVNIKYYVTMIGSYAVGFSLSYVDDSHLTELEKIVASMKFARK